MTAVDMGTEDKLFRALRPAVDALLDQQQRKGAALDFDALAGKLLDDHSSVFDLGAHGPALRLRLKALLEERSRSRAGSVPRLRPVREDVRHPQRQRRSDDEGE